MTTTDERFERLAGAHAQIGTAVHALKALADEPGADSAELVPALHFLDTGLLWLTEATETAHLAHGEDPRGLVSIG